MATIIENKHLRKQGNDRTAVSTADPFETPFDDENDEHTEIEDDGSESDNEEGMLVEQGVGKESHMTMWPGIDRSTTNANNKSKRKSTQKRLDRYSVQRLTRDKSRQRQKKQNMLAGIKVVTDFTSPRNPINKPKHARLPSESSSNQPPVGGGQFIDLAALKALESQAPSNDGWLWKSIMDMLPSKSETLAGPSVSQTVENNQIKRLSSRRDQDRLQTPLQLDSGLSPSDRPIFIGMAVPSTGSDPHIPSPQTATSETSKIIQSYESRSPYGDDFETPAIMITPAQAASPWSDDQNSAGSAARPRATSSVYSRGPSYGSGVPASPNAPPMPQMPNYAVKSNQDLAKSRKAALHESTGTVFSDDVEWSSPRRSRAMSSSTIFEDDLSPILARKERGRSVSVNSKHTSARHSKGWWNLMTPLMSRSNTSATPQTTTQEHPPLPSLNTATLKAHARSQESNLEKTFSPTTPFSSTTISSDAWWDKQSPSGPVSNPFRQTINEGFASKAFAAETQHKRQKSEVESQTLEFMLSPPLPLQVETSVNREPSTRTIGATTLSPSDREAPFILSQIGSLNANTSYSRISETPSAERAEIIGNFPQPPQSVAATSASNYQGSPQPPPYSPPRQDFLRYRAILPPGHRGMQPNVSQTQAPSPVSPGLQQAMYSGDGIALASMPMPPQEAHRPVIKLNSAYPGLPANPRANLPITASDLGMSSEKSRKAEAKRRRHEREDAIAHKAGGLWRGRGCIPDRGCYGRRGAEGRQRRRVWLGLVAGSISLLILVVVLATTLHRTHTQQEFPSQWLNLTGFPPIFTGISTVAAPDNPVANTGCVFPSTLWSCALPKEQQSSVAPSLGNQPSFRFNIQWDNSSAANATFANITNNHSLPVRNVGGLAAFASRFVKRRVLGRQITNFQPSPLPPSLAEQFFLGNTTDGIVSGSKAGEPTPFYITFMTSTSILSLSKRASTKPISNQSTPNTTTSSTAPSSSTSSTSNNTFPDIESLIPPPDSNPDGTAAPANLLPFPFQQPLRLYDRGLSTEHYGFYTYFNRSIFLKSTAPLNGSNLGSGSGSGEVPDDLNGGSLEAAAKVRCTWSETRFLVQIWTRKGNTAVLLSNSSSSSTNPTIQSLTNPLPTTSTISANDTANAFLRPGSFPYPVSITTDRHGGDPAKKGVYCYALDDREENIPGSAKVQLERRGFGGTLVNGAGNIFGGNDSGDGNGFGGFDGGTGGCGCGWVNWRGVINA